MQEDHEEIKLPELPPLSSFSLRSINKKGIKNTEIHAIPSKNLSLPKKETQDENLSSLVLDEHIERLSEEDETRLHSSRVLRTTIKEVQKHEFSSYTFTKDTPKEDIIRSHDFLLETEKLQGKEIKNQKLLLEKEEKEISSNKIVEENVHQRFMIDAENTLYKLNLYSNNNSFADSISSKFNKPPSVKSSVSVFNPNKQSSSRPVPPSTEDISGKDYLTKRRPNMQLTSRKNQEQVLSGATILPPRSESSVSMLENNSFYNKNKDRNPARIKTSDLLEDLQLFHYIKPSPIVGDNQYRSLSAGSNLSSISSPLSGDLDYFTNNNNNYSEFIQNNNFESRVPSFNTPTSNSNSNHNITNNYQFQSRVPSSSHRSDNRNTSVSSYSGSKPLFQVPSVSIPTYPFKIDLLTEDQLHECKNIYSINEIYEWLLKIYFEWFSNYVFDKMIFFQIIQLLIEFNISSKYTEDFINKNVDQIIESLLRQRAIRFETGLTPEVIDNDVSVSNISFEKDELTIITPGLEISGVITNLTKCFCCERFVVESPYKCCSFICSKYRLEQSISKTSEPEQKLKRKQTYNNNATIGVWSEYWNLSDEELSRIPPSELKKQSFIFDLIILEERSINMANAATQIYGKKFYKQLLPNNLNFEDCAFQIFSRMSNLHQTYILDPLYDKLQTDGKFIKSIGEIYLRWVDKATKLYLEYAECMGVVTEVLNWEKAQPVSKFRDWLKEVEDTPEIKMSKLYHDVIFLGGFFKSLQNLPITLTSILKCSSEDEEDYEFIKIALEEIVALNTAVDKLLGTSMDRAHILRISKQLIINKNFKAKFDSLYSIQSKEIESEVDDVAVNDKLELRLNEKQRKLLNEGELIKKRDVHLPSQISGHTRSYLFLFDNVLLITEKVVQKGQFMFKLSERPIPIDYLNLESKIGVTSSWEFKIRNIATNDSFSFVASSADSLLKWTDSISLMLHKFSNNKEDQLIFKLKCVNDSFTYKDGDFSTNLSVPTINSALDHALKQIYNGNTRDEDKDTESSLQESKSFFADVSTVISVVFENVRYTLLATNLGLYLKNNKKKSKNNKLGDWKFVCKIGGIQKIELCPMINFLILLDSRGYLFYISLQSIILSYYKSGPSYDDGSDTNVVGILIDDKVSSFTIAEDLESSLQLCYQRKGKIICNIPEYDFFTNSIRTFKFHKTYHLPSSSLLTNANTAVSLHSSDGNRYLASCFKESFIVANSTNGFILYNSNFNNHGIQLPRFPDVLIDPVASEENLDKLHSLERLSKEKSLLNRIQEIVKHKVTAIRSFMLNASGNIVLVYNNTVVLMSNNGLVVNGIKDILMIDFSIKSCAMHGDYLILCGENLVQVYDLNQELLVERFMFDLQPLQIIKGKKMKLVSSDHNNKMMLLMSHPLIVGKQLVLEFIKV